jgi:mannose-6-phosphate isomerase-like protein (cupin superfamily)
VGEGSYGRTSGTESRAGRPMMERLMVFRLTDEIAALRQEEAWREGDRNARTLAKEVDFRVLLTVLRAGVTIGEDSDARASLQLVEGRASLQLNDGQADLETGQVAVVDAGQQWSLRAEDECVLLLTLAWPRGKAVV